MGSAFKQGCIIYLHSVGGLASCDASSCDQPGDVAPVSARAASGGCWYRMAPGSWRRDSAWRDNNTAQSAACTPDSSLQ